MKRRHLVLTLLVASLASLVPGALYGVLGYVLGLLGLILAGIAVVPIVSEWLAKDHDPPEQEAGYYGSVDKYAASEEARLAGEAERQAAAPRRRRSIVVRGDDEQILF